MASSGEKITKSYKIYYVYDTSAHKNTFLYTIEVDVQVLAGQMAFIVLLLLCYILS